MIRGLFLLANTLIFLPALLYGGSLFMQTMFQLDINLMYLVFGFAIVGAAYAILGGLRAVAVSDTYSGVLILGMSILVVFLSLKSIGFDLSGIPKERLSMIGGNDSPIPWHTLPTGMIFIQTFYWSTNQTITQRAMAAPNLKEAQKGVFAAAAIRLLIVPAIVVIPGIVAYKLYGDIGDTAYGRIVGLLFNNVHAKAAINTVIFGTGLYAVFSFGWEPLHYIHLMLITLISCVLVALVVNRVVFKQRARLVFSDVNP